MGGLWSLRSTLKILARVTQDDSYGTTQWNPDTNGERSMYTDVGLIVQCLREILDVLHDSSVAQMARSPGQYCCQMGSDEDILRKYLTSKEANPDLFAAASLAAVFARQHVRNSERQNGQSISITSQHPAMPVGSKLIVDNPCETVEHIDSTSSLLESLYNGIDLWELDALFTPTEHYIDLPVLSGEEVDTYFRSLAFTQNLHTGPNNELDIMSEPSSSIEKAVVIQEVLSSELTQRDKSSPNKEAAKPQDAALRKRVDVITFQGSSALVKTQLRTSRIGDTPSTSMAKQSSPRCRRSTSRSQSSNHHPIHGLGTPRRTPRKAARSSQLPVQFSLNLKHQVRSRAEISKVEKSAVWQPKVVVECVDAPRQREQILNLLKRKLDS